MKEVNCIILCLGYVEGAAVTPLIFTTAEGCGGCMSEREALVALAEDLFAVFESERPGPSKCCLEHTESDFKHCPTCGKNLKTTANIWEYDFRDKIWGILGKDNDSYGYEGVELESGWHSFRWAPTTYFLKSVKEDTYLFVPENGARILVNIIEMLKPGTFEDIEEAQAYLCMNDDESFESWLDRNIKKGF